MKRLCSWNFSPTYCDFEWIFVLFHSRISLTKSFQKYKPYTRKHFQICHKRSGSSLYIDYFALDESYRGNGFGTQLLTYFLNLFLETKGSIHLFPLNDTIANWYIKYGFQRSGKGYYVIHSHKTRSSHVRNTYANN